MSTTYLVGDSATITSPTFVVGATPTNPATLTLVVTDGAGTSTSYAVGTLTHPSTGIYTKAVTVSVAGTWSWLFTATGVDNTLGGGSFEAVGAHVYCTSAETKAWLNITDSNLDSVVALANSAASRWVEGFCGDRRFWKDSAVTARVYDVARDGTIYTDDIADTTGLVVKTDTAADGTYATTIASTAYQVLPLNSPYGGQAYPWTQIAPTVTAFPVHYLRTGLVQVTAKWGWPAVPDDVRQATIMQAARIVKRRSSPEGAAGFNDFGVVRVTSTDRDVEALLQPYVLIGFA